jgi:hypothetical protein
VRTRHAHHTDLNATGPYGDAEVTIRGARDVVSRQDSVLPQPPERAPVVEEVALTTVSKPLPLRLSGFETGPAAFLNRRAHAGRAARSAGDERRRDLANRGWISAPGSCGLDDARS